MSENLFMRILGNFFVVLIRAYQICISPFLGPCCRFYSDLLRICDHRRPALRPLRGVFPGPDAASSLSPLAPRRIRPGEVKNISILWRYEWTREPFSPLSCRLQCIHLSDLFRQAARQDAAPAPTQQEATVAPQTAKTAPPRRRTQAAAPAAIQTATTGRMAAAQAVTGTERDVIVETPLYRAVFTTRGAALKSFQLKQYKTALENSEDLVDIFYRLIGKGKPKPKGQPKLVELVHVSEGMPRPLAVSFPDSTVNIPEDGFYEADGSMLDMTKGADPRKLTFTQTYPGELKIDKIFTFHPDKYSFELEVRVHNLAAFPLNQNGGLTWYQYVDPSAPTDSYGHDGPVSYIAKSIDRPEVAKIEADKVLGPDVSWGGFESKYFIASLIPQNPSLTSFRMSKDSSNLIAVSLKGPKNVIPPGSPASSTIPSIWDRRITPSSRPRTSAWKTPSISATGSSGWPCRSSSPSSSSTVTSTTTGSRSSS